MVERLPSYAVELLEFRERRSGFIMSQLSGRLGSLICSTRPASTIALKSSRMASAVAKTIFSGSLTCMSSLRAKLPGPIEHMKPSGAGGAIAFSRLPMSAAIAAWAEYFIGPGDRTARTPARGVPTNVPVDSGSW